MDNPSYDKSFEMKTFDGSINPNMRSVYQQHKPPSQTNLAEKGDTQSVNSLNAYHVLDSVSVSSVSVTQTTTTTTTRVSTAVSPTTIQMDVTSNGENQVIGGANRYRRKITKSKQDSSYFNLATLEGRESNANGAGVGSLGAGQKGEAKVPKPGEDIHWIPIKEFLARVQSDHINGLTTGEAEMRLIRDGPNTLKKRRRLPMPVLFLRELFTGFGPIYWLIVILLVISFEPLGGSNPSYYNLALAIITFLVLFISSLLSFIVKFRANKLMEHFLKMLPRTTLTLREGQWKDIESTKLVIGDVIRLHAGNQFPADVRALEAAGAKMDKSALTGESKLVTLTSEPTDPDINESHNLGYMGTNLVEGEATCVIYARGNNTCIGRIATLSDRTKRKMTNLERDIYIFMIIMLVLSLMSILIVVLYWVLYLRVAWPNVLNVAALISLCAACPIAFLPVGLAIAYVCSLMIVATQMKSANVAVKNLNIIETLGAVSVICSDKTGTITQNKMTLSHVWMVGADEEDEPVDRFHSNNEENANQSRYPRRERTMSVTSNTPKSALALTGHRSNEGAIDLIDPGNNEASPWLKFMMTLTALCNGATIDHESKHITGSSTESALLAGAMNFVNVDEIRDEFFMSSQVPFDSSRKYQITVHDCDASKLGKFITPNSETSPNFYRLMQTSKSLVIAKGGSEIIMDMCRLCLYNDEIVTFTEDKRSAALNAMQALAANGERVLGLAFSMEPDPSDMLNVENQEIENRVKQDLCFLALTSLLDPPKIGVREAVRDCHSAFIKVAMVTGDHPSTAKAIARKVDIFRGEQKPMTLDDIREKLKDAATAGIEPPVDRESQILILGKEISSIREPEWKYILNHWEFVFARTTPENKLEIVKQFQDQKNTVAVTGDGVNDAAALKRADVGIAMGIMGSEISKEAANVILADDNFASIVNGIRVGRLVFNNLRKVICYLIPQGSFVELMAIFINTFLGVPLPESAFLMVAICVCTDVIGGIAMVYEPAESELMKKKPRNARKHHLVDLRLMMFAYLDIGLISTIASMINYYVAMYFQGNCKMGELFFAYNFGIWPSASANETNVTMETTVLTNLTTMSSTTTNTMSQLMTTLNSNLTYCGLNPDEQIAVLAYGQTAFFTCSVMMNCWNFLAVTRTRRMSIFKQSFRKEHVFVVLAQLTLVVFFCYIPFFNNVMQTAPINWYCFLIPVGFGIILPLLDEPRKLLLRKKPKNKISKLAW